MGQEKSAKTIITNGKEETRRVTGHRKQYTKMCGLESQNTWTGIPGSQNMAGKLSSLNPAPFIYKEVTTYLWDSQINNINHNTYNTVLIASEFCSNKHSCSCSTSWFLIQSRIVLVYSFALHCSQPLHIKFSVSRVSDFVPVLFVQLVDGLYLQLSFL